MNDYYGKTGFYLEDHKSYLTKATLHRDVDFIVESLKLTMKDSILDLQCAQGRIAVALKQEGFHVDGLDQSEYMLTLAKQAATLANVEIPFIKGDIHHLRLPRLYSKVILFFPEWDGIDLKKVLIHVHRVMKRGGLFLCDQDALYRVWDYLKKHPKAPFTFDPYKMELIEDGEKIGNRYFTFPELKTMFEDAGFKIEKVYGGWTIADGEYKFNSKRLRVIAKKK
ncbi:methyltransferase domain-containing protein [Patescibacteria group bacterium]|nr:methyltransferase domain-containing protein [Patescibacteria group bacterium]